VLVDMRRLRYLDKMFGGLPFYRRVATTHRTAFGLLLPCRVFHEASTVVKSVRDI